MENNVHRDVYNADVCTKARRGKCRGRRKRKRLEWDRSGAREKSSDEKEEENRRQEMERKGEYG